MSNTNQQAQACEAHKQTVFLIQAGENEAYRFSGPAAMGPGRNTRVSAVLRILPVRMHRKCIEAGRLWIEFTEGFSRELTDDEVHWIHQQTSESMGQVETAMRMVVVKILGPQRCCQRACFAVLLTNDGLRYRRHRSPEIFRITNRRNEIPRAGI